MIINARDVTNGWLMCCICSNKIDTISSVWEVVLKTRRLWLALNQERLEIISEWICIRQQLVASNPAALGST